MNNDPFGLTKRSSSSEDLFHTKHYKKNLGRVVKAQAYAKMYVYCKRYRAMLQDRHESVIIYEQMSKQSSRANLDVKQQLKSK